MYVLYDPAVPLPDRYSRKMHTNVPQKTCPRMFIAALYIIAKK